MAAKWRGQWIWVEGEESPRNFYLYLRREFALPDSPKPAMVRVTADSRYILWVNGKLICRGPVRSDPRWQSFDEVDITKYLRKGPNVLAALVHHYGEPTYSYHLGQGAFLLDCCIRTSGGAKVNVSTGPDWKVLPSSVWEDGVRRITRHQGFYEIAHPALEPVGWKEPGCDESAWLKPKVIGPVGTGPWKRLVPREIPFQTECPVHPVAVLQTGMVTEHPPEDPASSERNIALIMQSESLKPHKKSKAPIWKASVDSLLAAPSIEDLMASSIFLPDGSPWQYTPPSSPAVIQFKPDTSSDSGCYLLFDFGREVSGFPHIELESDSSGTIDLGYGELLFDGRIDPFRSNVCYADRVIAQPGITNWQSFEKRAFRYMQVDLKGFRGEVKLKAVSLVFSTYPVKWRGRVETSDPGLNRLWNLGTYTVQLNMDDAFMDCPWRERVQWWGDALVEAMVAYYAFGDTRLIRQGIRHIAQSQRDNGITQCFYPGVSENAIPGFCLAWILSLSDYYEWTGDKKAVREHWPQVVRLLEWFIQRIQPSGILGELHEYWNFWDWADEFVNIERPSIVANAFFAGALQAAGELARVAGDKSASANYRGIRKKLVRAANQLFWDSSVGLYRDYPSDSPGAEVQFSQQGNAAAALFAVCSEGRSASILKKVLKGHEGLVEIATPYFACYLLKALFQAGLSRQALAYINENWKDMLDSDATTLWEHFDQKASLCHGWSAAPTWAAGAHILGIRPACPGWKSVLIAPEPSGLAQASGSAPTPQGDIRVAWRLEKDLFVLDINLPRKMDAAVVLPFAWKNIAGMRLNGRKQKPGKGEAQSQRRGASLAFTGMKRIQIEASLLKAKG